METVVNVWEDGPSSTIKLGWAKLMKPLTAPVPWQRPVLHRSSPLTKNTRHWRKQQLPAEGRRENSHTFALQPVSAILCIDAGYQQELVVITKTVGVACSLCNHPWHATFTMMLDFAYLLSSVSCFLGCFSCCFSALFSCLTKIIVFFFSLRCKFKSHTQGHAYLTRSAHFCFVWPCRIADVGRNVNLIKLLNVINNWPATSRCMELESFYNSMQSLVYLRSILP